MPVATGAGPGFSKAGVGAASALPLRQLLNSPDVVDHRQRQPGFQRKADTTVLFAILGDQLPRQIGIGIEDADTFHCPRLEEPGIDDFIAEKLDTLMPGVAGDAEEGLVDILESAFDNLKKMASGGEQEPGNLGKRIVGFAMMQDFFDDWPVQFPGDPALVDQAIHDAPPFACLQSA